MVRGGRTRARRWGLGFGKGPAAKCYLSLCYVGGHKISDNVFAIEGNTAMSNYLVFPACGPAGTWMCVGHESLLQSGDKTALAAIQDRAWVGRGIVVSFG